MKDDRHRFRRDHFGNRWIISLGTFHIEGNIDKGFVCYNVWRDDIPTTLYVKAEEIDKFIQSLKFAKKNLEVL